MRLLDVLPIFSFTTSETMPYYYLFTWYIRDASRIGDQLKSYNLRKWENIRKVSKPHWMIAQCPEYITALTKTRLSICQDFGYASAANIWRLLVCQGSKYTTLLNIRALNISGSWIYHSFKCARALNILR